MHKSKVRTSLPNLEVDGARLGSGRAVTANAAGGVRLEDRSLAVRRARFRLDSLSVAMEADDDFGSVKLCDLPDGNLIIVGALVDLVAVGVDGSAAGLDSIDVAVGTAPVASTTFANAGEDDIVPKLDADAGGVIQGGPTGTEALGFLAASSDSVYLNVVDVITADGAIEFTGWVELLYIDLGDPAA
jgi:hypothetical protein